MQMDNRQITPEDCFALLSVYSKLSKEALSKTTTEEGLLKLREISTPLTVVEASDGAQYRKMEGVIDQLKDYLKVKET